MLRFKDFLSEQSKGLVELLRPYKNNPDIYISYTQKDKIGINPESKYDSTPNGIYTYPLKEMWKDLKNNTMPWVSSPIDSPYVWVLKSKNPKGFVKDLYTDYTKKDFNRDLKKIRKLWEEDINKIKTHVPAWLRGKIKIDDTVSNFDDLIDSITKRSIIPSSQFWEITRKISSRLFSSNIITERNLGSTWNVVLRKLGYAGFADKSGKGIIHSGEKTQAVFLRKTAFEIIDKFENKY